MICTLYIINHKVGNMITVKVMHVVYRQYDAYNNYLSIYFQKL